MPRDYDKARAVLDLDFVIGSQTFAMHLLPMQVVSDWSEREAEVKLTDQPAFQQMCVERIADAVDDGNGSRDRWLGLCASKDAPSYGELLDLARWAWEVQSDLPTMQSSPSGPGPRTAAESSKAG